MAEVDVGGGRVDAELDPQRPPLGRAARPARPRAEHRRHFAPGEPPGPRDRAWANARVRPRLGGHRSTLCEAAPNLAALTLAAVLFSASRWQVDAETDDRGSPKSLQTATAPGPSTIPKTSSSTSPWSPTRRRPRRPRSPRKTARAPTATAPARRGLRAAADRRGPSPDPQRDRARRPTETPAATADPARPARPCGSTASGPRCRAGLRRLGRRSSGTIPPPPPPPTALGNGSGGGSGKPRLKKLRFAFVLAGLDRPGRRLHRLRNDDGRRLGSAGARGLRPVPGLQEHGRPRRDRGARSEPCSSNENKILLESEPDLAEHQERRRRDRGRGASTSTAASTSRASAAPWSRTSSPCSAKQGASTITQQFVKKALEAQGSRTVFQKLREAALAYHLERQWTKDKILTEYLNTIYFGQGAYGIEAAARTYFGGPAPRLRHRVRALRRGAAPRGGGAARRDDLLALRLRPQGLPRERARAPQPGAGEDARAGLHRRRAVTPMPSAPRCRRPTTSSRPRSTRGPLLHRLAAPAARRPATRAAPAAPSSAASRCRRRSTSTCRRRPRTPSAPTSAASARPPRSSSSTTGPAASARWSAGPTSTRRPSTSRPRASASPGSSIKPFTLLTALEQGYSAYSPVYESGAEDPSTVPNSPGRASSSGSTTTSDNYLGSASIADGHDQLRQLGLRPARPRGRGTDEHRRDRARARRRDPLSTNPAMMLGGLKIGVTPLEWAYAFNTIANDGRRVTGTLRARLRGAGGGARRLHRGRGGRRRQRVENDGRPRAA